ncbi:MULTISPECIES: ATP-binding protein [unclassified Sphingobacterium]|uniref:AAA family ATPase n=1 Tax=unclassified Sphingobacterium TaxID=2609468 RepID=UPI00104D47BB|nr:MULTISPECIES: ATP-binding protein [unclassified Sphingobacterium]MCS3553580.1 AAA15 family ATPase/GTPase [Sphingobacterium sp. JUb21]TCR09212.1 putative AbiEii toxin of type IV toxin-antitoxin system [Sphingobacterium sp. JUb20]
MIINILDNGKILKEQFNIFLPDLTVLTGENGSGKTQFLESIRDNAHGYWERHDFEMMNNPGIDSQMIFPMISNEGLELKDIHYSYPGLKSSEFEYTENQSLIQTIKQQWNILHPISKCFSSIKGKIFDNEQAELVALNSSIELFARSLHTNPNAISPLSLKKTNSSELNQLKNLAQQTKKNIDNLTFLDFLIFYSVPTHIFSSALDLLFHQFHLKQKYYPALTENISTPWDVFNEMLIKAKFKYKAEYLPSNNEETPPPVTFVDNENGKPVPISSLSSGEKTIMALIFVLYHASSNGNFPEVILFDEPDAHLHPSLTQLFINVIQETLVNEQKVKVILTTHSPSTIALSPPNSIYRMDRSLGYPVKEDRNKAVQALSDGLASITMEDGNLGIVYNLQNTDKHIVFTEGITDKIILEIAWKKLYPDQSMPFFIQDCFSANFLGSLFNEGDQRPDGIFIQFPHKKLIAVFDFDLAGYSNWKREKKFPHLMETDPAKCLTRNNGQNGFLLLLPATQDQKIKKLVLKNDHETFEEKSHLTVESLFLNAPSFIETYFSEEAMPGGGTIYLFKGKKRKFAENLKELDPIHFKEFIALFDKLQLLISD